MYAVLPASGIGVYRAFIRNAFLNMLAYRLRYYTGIVTYLILVSVHYFIWNAVYSEHPEGAVINGFTFAEMVTYVSVGWIARSLYFSNIDDEINELVRTGQISVYLLRPVSFHLMMLCQGAGESCFRLLFFTLPIGAVIVSVFPVMLPPTVAYAVLFAIATIFSFLILAEVNFLIGMCAFYFKSISGIMRAKYFIIQLFSGLLLPLSFFPGWFQSALDAMPFKIIAYIPLRLYLGKIPLDQMASVFLTQIIWFVVLLCFGQFVWRRAVSKLTLQGG